MRQIRAIAVIALWLASVPAVCRADTLIQWSSNSDSGRATYAVGNLHLMLTNAVNDRKEGPRLQATSSTGATITVYGAERAWNAPVTLRVTRLDPAHSSVDVMFGTFTGGAHCCTAIKILSLIDGAWRVTDLGDWDGSGMPAPRQFDNGKTVALVFPDNAFLYAFTYYAASATPLKILEIRNGAVVDVSGNPVFNTLHRQNMAQDRQSCVEGSNGGCAAYVASAARLGLLAEAWKFMLAHYDRKSDWRLQFCDVPAKDKCAKTVAFDTFPQALDWFLRKHGYLPAARPE